MENVRVDSLLGNKKVIVGNPYSDIVLETLGKVYVKTGNNLKVLSDVLKLLDQANEKDSTGTIIVDSQSAMEEMEYPGDGRFIFNTLTKTLYISYDERYVALITAEDGEGSDKYVKKSGDVITGKLEFTTNEAPLIVASSKLVKNFNAEYVGGYAADKLAKRLENEYIYGNWTFKSSGTSEDTWLFKRNVRFNQDLIIDGSLSTAQFQSGYGGYGWRLDSTTNTLTIDYLVVRKAMRVYEMVINKITATNGSIWVTNASKADNVYYPIVCSINDLDGTADSGKLWASDAYYLFTETWSSTGYKFFIYITDYSALINNPEFTGKEMLLDEALLTREVTESDTSDFIELRNNVKLFYVYSSDFAKDVEFEYIENISDYEETGVTKTINIYDTYYGKNPNGDLLNNNFYIVVTDDEEYPLLKPNDLVRCQKWSNGNIKYYDAIVTNQLGSYSYVMQKAISVFDKYTEINYNEDGTVASMTEEYNDKLYSMTEDSETTTNVEDRLDEIAIGDDIIQMGNLVDANRQNAIYLTSTDDYSPYIDIISELTRPDYSVVYRIPKYITDKDGNEVNYEMVKKLDSEGNPVIGSDGEPVMVKKYIYKYTKTCKVRLGNLGGIRDSTFPENKQPRGYGLYADNVFLTGEFYLNNGKSIVDVSQDGIILKYKRAGLELLDLYDEQGNPIYLTDKDGNIIKDDNGNPVQKQEIKLNAEQIKVGDEETYALFKVIYENGEKKIYLNADLIQASEIYNLKESADASVITTIDSSVSKTPTNAVTDWTYAAKYFFPEYGQTPNWNANYHPDGGGDFSSKTNGTFELTTPSTDFNSYILTNRIEAVAATIGKVTMEMTVTQLTSDISKYEVALLDLENPGNYFVIPLISNDGVNFKWEKTLNVKMEGDYAVGIQIKSSGVSGTDIYSALKATISAEEKSYYWALWSDGSGVLAEERIQWDNLGNLSITASKLTVNDGRYKIGLYSSNDGCYLQCYGSNKENPYAKIGCSFNAIFQRYQGYLSLASGQGVGESSDGLYASFNVLTIADSSNPTFPSQTTTTSASGYTVSSTNSIGSLSTMYIHDQGLNCLFTSGSSGIVSAGFRRGRVPNLQNVDLGDVFRIPLGDIDRIYNGTAEVLMIKTG